VRAVYRGYKSGAVDTQAYMIVVEFACKSFKDGNETDEDAESYCSSSDDQFEFQKEKLRMRQQRD